MVLYKSGEKLYKGVMQLVTDNLEKLAREEVFPAFPSGASTDPMQKSQEGEMLLKALRRIWDDHTGNMVKLGQILKYMVPSSLCYVPRLCLTPFKQDRVYTKAAEVPETWEAGLGLFLKHIIRPPIKDHIVTAILNQVEFERDGYVINRSAVRGCVDIFRGLDIDFGGPSVYEHDLEPAILRDSRTFYEKEGERLVETCDASEFLRRVSLCLSQYVVL